MCLFNHSLCKICLLLLIYISPFYSQDSVKIFIPNFKNLNVDVKELDILEIEFPRQLQKQFSQSKEANFRTIISQEIMNRDSINELSTERMVQFDNIQNTIDRIGKSFDYIISGDFLIDKESSKIVIRINLVNSKTGIIEFKIKEEELLNVGELISEKNEIIQNQLAQKIFKRIENFITSRVRIGILEFKMTGGNFEIKNFEKSLPTMLTSSLSTSNGFKMIEIKSDSITNRINKGFIDPDLVLKRGLQNNVNYLIMGEFFELNNEIRIDIKCVNIETLEILLSNGINIKHIEIAELTEAISRLASSISSIVNNDFSKRETPLKSLAVICFPPIPLTRVTKIKSENIQRTIVRKLRYVDELRLLEDPEIVNEYFEKEEDKFKICSNLGVNNLISLRFQELDDNTEVLEVDLFSLERPTLELFKMAKKSNEGSDQFINNVIVNTMSALNLKMPDKDSINWRGITVQKYLTFWTIGLKFSNVDRPKFDKKVYLNDGLGDYWEAFLTYQYNDWWSLELILGYDFGKKSKTLFGEEIRVSSRQIGVLAKYEIEPVIPISIYGGLGAMVFWTYRGFESNQGITEEKGEQNYGLLATLGLEVKLNAIGISIFLEPRYIYTTTINDAQTSSGFIFPGGRLGGFYTMIGIGYNFNWPKWL